MTIVLDVGDKIVPMLSQILTLLQAEAKTMADVQTDLDKLVSEVTSNNTDVLAILQQLTNSGLNPQQKQMLEGAITALGDTNTKLEAAITPVAMAKRK